MLDASIRQKLAIVSGGSMLAKSWKSVHSRKILRSTISILTIYIYEFSLQVNSDKLIGRTPGTLGPRDRRRRSRSAGRSSAARIYGANNTGKFFCCIQKVFFFFFLNFKIDYYCSVTSKNTAIPVFTKFRTVYVV